ncbi:MAG TPA: SGNH hydrolase domain-containing protein [Acidimicrobiales bacterium]|nr:SGNH hydrolase domain-containing protein [Acidimicrobiales bacterium]
MRLQRGLARRRSRERTVHLARLLAVASVAVASCGVVAAAGTSRATVDPVAYRHPRPAPVAASPLAHLPAGALSALITTVLRPAPPPPPPPPPHHRAGQPVTIMFIGDSVAQTTAAGLGPLASQYGGAIANEGIMGCGVVTASPYRYFGQQQNLLPQCESWQATWRAAVAHDNPDLAVIMVGRWELMERFYDGRWTHVGDPAYDAYIVAQLQQAVAIASAQRAKVALLTTPYYLRGLTPTGGLFPEDQPARVDLVNGLIRQVAASHPGLVSVIDFGAHLSPGGKFAMAIDGVQVRSDGVHMTPQTGPWLAPWLMPQLVALGAKA